VIGLDNEYKTILKESTAEIKEKKSRFIASAKPASSEEEALEFINSLKTRYWNATHNVYAYYIVGENIIQRFSDDGEPSGTAGMPVLEVIKRKDLQNLVVVVTRYFGGTLLGAAGLIRAYGKSASLAVEAAVIVKKRLCTEVNIMVEYPLLGRIQNFLGLSGYAIKNIIYGQDVEIIAYVPVDAISSFTSLVEEASNAQAIIAIGSKAYITVDEEGKIIKE
jgi:uncharacterized YigZ family protein